jgi:hypothetical protein
MMGFAGKMQNNARALPDTLKKKSLALYKVILFFNLMNISEG